MRCIVCAGLAAVAAASFVRAGTLTAPDIDVIPFVEDVARAVEVMAVPGWPDHYFIAEQRVGSTNQGRIRLWDRSTNTFTTFMETPVIGTQGPQGLLAMAVDPNYAENGYIYINFTDFAGISQIERYTRSATDPGVVDPASRRFILYVPQIGPTHNAAWLEFGPDGYLWLGTGDGGNGGDIGNNAQNISNGRFLGKILRLDPHGDDFPSGALNYAIPPDNPFVGTGNDEEIWAYGFRHPWRCAFDPLTNDLYIADVGDATWEEINFQPASSMGGENYGWRCREAAYPSHPDSCAPETVFVEPIHHYAHFTSGEPFRCSVIGGEVYRGSAIPELQGCFIFADYCSSEIWALRHDIAGGTEVVDLTAALQGCGVDLTGITGFGLDEEGEILILARTSGVIYKIVPSCPQDVDKDGSIDFKDLNLLLDHWGMTDVAGDTDGDCDVDFADLNVLLEYWGTACP